MVVVKLLKNDPLLTALQRITLIYLDSDALAAEYSLTSLSAELNALA